MFHCQLILPAVDGASRVSRSGQRAGLGLAANLSEKAEPHFDPRSFLGRSIFLERRAWRLKFSFNPTCDIASTTLNPYVTKGGDAGLLSLFNERWTAGAFANSPPPLLGSLETVAQGKIAGGSWPR